MATFAILCMCFLATVNALTCNSDSLKVTIEDSEYDLNQYERYEMKATIAYSLQKYCGGELASYPDPDCPYDITAEEVELRNQTDRIAVCVFVDQFDPNVVRTAIRASKANLNGALLLTDNELFVAGILPTLPPNPDPDFAPWLIAYIVIFGLVLLGGLAMVIYTKFYSGGNSDEEKSMLEDGIEDISSDDSLPVKEDHAYEQTIEIDDGGTML